MQQRNKERKVKEDVVFQKQMKTQIKKTEETHTQKYMHIHIHTRSHAQTCTHVDMHPCTHIPSSKISGKTKKSQRQSE